jgi:PAS domain S-box-containing protein
MEIEKVLVVDDDDALLHLLTLALRRNSYQVESAGDGLSALEMLRSQGPFAVLLTDLMMPRMSGMDLMREARQLDPYIEIIVITAAGTLESAIAALRAHGAYDYLLKPLESMSQLAVVVDRAMSHRRLIMEREALQHQVQTEAERLKALIANTGDAILSADQQDILTIANPAAVHLLHIEDLIGREASNVFPPALTKLVSNWKVVGSQTPAVVEIPWGDGSVQMISLTPLTDGNGSHQGWVMVMTDITHLKRLDELKAKMLSDALGKVRLPMAQAINDLAELNLYASQDERIAEVVYRMTKVWERIQDWGDDLMALTALGSGMEVHPVYISLPEMVGDVWQGLEKEMTRGRGVKLEQDMPPDLAPVYTDPTLLHQLLRGLIKRAGLRNEPGGVIQLQARTNEDQVWVEVSEGEQSVAKDGLPRVFDELFTSANGGNGGVDVEMATVKTIIDRIGGQVWFGRRGVHGSTITICLPKHAEAEKV